RLHLIDRRGTPTRLITTQSVRRLFSNSPHAPKSQVERAHMPLTYDQKSEIRMAFDEAFVPSDRRRDSRVKNRIDTTMCTWKSGKQGEPVGVRIEDFSTGGVGLTHSEPMDLGLQYLLRVPRPDMP